MFSGRTTLNKRKDGSFRNSNRTCRVSSDKGEGYSYGELIFKRVLLDGEEVTFFNEFNFSNTTSRHQRELSRFVSGVVVYVSVDKLSNFVTRYSYTKGEAEQLFETILLKHDATRDLSFSLVYRASTFLSPYLLDTLTKSFEARKEAHDQGKKNGATLSRLKRKISALDYSSKQNLFKSMRRCLELDSKTSFYIHCPPMRPKLDLFIAACTEFDGRVFSYHSVGWNDLRMKVEVSEVLESLGD